MIEGEPHIGETIAELASYYIGAKSIQYPGPEPTQTILTGFDCSGFVREILAGAQVKIPKHVRHTTDFFDEFGVFVPWGSQQVGDITIITHFGEAPAHAGIYSGIKKGRQYYIHSPGKSDQFVKESELTQEPVTPLNHGQKPTYPEKVIGFKRTALKFGRNRLTSVSLSEIVEYNKLVTSGRVNPHNFSYEQMLEGVGESSLLYPLLEKMNAQRLELLEAKRARGING